MTSSSSSSACLKLISNYFRTSHVIQGPVSVQDATYKFHDVTHMQNGCLKGVLIPGLEFLTRPAPKILCVMSRLECEWLHWGWITTPRLTVRWLVLCCKWSWNACFYHLWMPTHSNDLWEPYRYLAGVASMRESSVSAWACLQIQGKQHYTYSEYNHWSCNCSQWKQYSHTHKRVRVVEEDGVAKRCEEKLGLVLWFPHPAPCAYGRWLSLLYCRWHFPWSGLWLISRTI